MGIENIDKIIRERDRQLGGSMLGSVEQPKDRSDEVVELLRLIFGYLKESFKEINEKLDSIIEQEKENK